MKPLICHKCGSSDTTILGPFYLLDKECNPTEEVEGYQCECNACLLFWDDYIVDDLLIRGQDYDEDSYLVELNER